VHPELNDHLESIKSKWYTPDDSNTSDYRKIPDGKYKCQLHDAQFQLSKAGNWMLRWEHKIIDGEYEGATHNEYLTLNIAFKITECSKRFQQFGIQPDSETDSFSMAVNKSLEDLCVRAPTYTAEFRTKPNKDPEKEGWTNIYINQVDDGSELNFPSEPEILFQIGDKVSTYIDSEDGSGKTQTIDGVIESFQVDDGVRSAVIVDKNDQRYGIDPSNLMPSESLTNSETITILCQLHEISGITLEDKKEKLSKINWSDRDLKDNEKLMLSKIGIDIN